MIYKEKENLIAKLLEFIAYKKDHMVPINIDEYDVKIW